MENEKRQPAMMTVREIARTGLLSEHAIRIMLKAGKLPAIYIGKKALINYDNLCTALHELDSDITKSQESRWTTMNLNSTDC